MSDLSDRERDRVLAAERAEQERHERIVIAVMNALSGARMPAEPDAGRARDRTPRVCEQERGLEPEAG